MRGGPLTARPLYAVVRHRLVVKYGKNLFLYHDLDWHCFIWKSHETAQSYFNLHADFQFNSSFPQLLLELAKSPV